MNLWYKRVVQDQADPAVVIQARDHFEVVYRDACAQMDTLRGRRLIEAETMLPGMVGYCYEQFTELNAIIEYLQIREDAVQGVKRRHYLEHYNRALSDRMVENFTESDAEVIGWRELRNHITIVRNQFEGLSKQYECMHYQLTNISKLRAAGLEEALY